MQTRTWAEPIRSLYSKTLPAECASRQSFCVFFRNAILSLCSTASVLKVLAHFVLFFKRLTSNSTIYSSIPFFRKLSRNRYMSIKITLPLPRAAIPPGTPSSSSSLSIPPKKRHRLLQHPEFIGASSSATESPGPVFAHQVVQTDNTHEDLDVALEDLTYYPAEDSRYDKQFGYRRQKRSKSMPKTPGRCSKKLAKRLSRRNCTSVKSLQKVLRSEILHPQP